MKLLRYTLMALSAFVLALPTLAQEQDTTDAELLQERGVAVRPLEEVTESAPQVLDITDTSARLNFIGTIPLACTIVFGETPDFGRASIDTDMNGGAIIEHNPLMLDLQPDTLYYYRVQGSGEDGTFYTSETLSFRTAPASSETTENLLAPENGAEVTGVSSNFGDADNADRFGILQAFDGNLNTAWSSAGDGDNAWFEVALAQTYRLDRIEFQSRSMNDGSSIIFEFTITTGDGETYGPFAAPDADQTYDFEVDIVADQLRFDVVDSSGGNTGAVEVAVYGEPTE
jgi:hypothetical protein